MIIVQKHLKTYGNILYWRDELALDDNDDTVDFNTPNAITDSWKKKIITRKNGNNRTKNVEIARPLKYLAYFWRTLNAFN